MDMGNIHTKMVIYIMDIGKMIIYLVLDMKYWKIFLYIQENIKQERKMGLEHINGKMVQYIWESGKIMIWKDLVYINLKMEDNI